MRASGEIVDPPDSVTLRMLAVPRLDPAPTADGFPWGDLFEENRWELVKLSRDDWSDHDAACLSCALSYRRASWLLSLESLPDPWRSVVDEIEGFPAGVTFPELKARLARMFTASSIRDKYLRAHLERGIRDGLIVATIDPDGIARYRRVRDVGGGG